MNCGLVLILATYFEILGAFTYLLSSKTRRIFRKNRYYANHLNFFLLIRQILFFLFPLSLASAIALFTYDMNWVFGQFPTLIALGLSIIIFWIVELPLLTKADIFVDFGVDDGNAIPEDAYIDRILLDPEKDNIVNTRIQNLGFSTLKNALVVIYLGDGVDVVPCDDPEYNRLDFPKRFTIQKTHCGIKFTPKENFQTVPPQEVLVFQTKIRKPKNLQKGEVTIQFSSENSWGLREIKAPIEIVKN